MALGGRKVQRPARLKFLLERGWWFIHRKPKGTKTRIVPLFPELKPCFEEGYTAAADGDAYVIMRYRSVSQNLRTTFLKFIERAGLRPWPKLFQNMRASRQTELEETFPSHVVCRWMGNSVKVAQKHYLQTTEAHYEKATQQASASLGITSLDASDTPQEPPEIVELPRIVRDKNNPTRARKSAENTGQTASISEGGAESGALDIQCGAKWAEVRELILACEELSVEVRQKLIALGDAEGGV